MRRGANEDGECGVFAIALRGGARNLELAAGAARFGFDAGRPFSVRYWPINPNTLKNVFPAPANQLGSASPRRPAMMPLSIVAILSKRTDDGILRPVPAPGPIGPYRPLSAWCRDRREEPK